MTQQSVACGVVLLVRHGETAANLEKRYSGRASDSLTARGRQQMEQLAAQLSDRELCEIRTSSVARARESAELLGSHLGVPVREDRRLDELVMGPWEGLTEEEVASRYPAEYRVWNERPDALAMGGRETLRELAGRIMAAVRDAWAMPRPAVLVTHVAPIRVAVLEVTGRGLHRYKTIHVANAACVELRLGSSQVRWFAQPGSAADSRGAGRGADARWNRYPEATEQR